VKLFGTRHEQLLADALNEAVYRLWSNIDGYDAAKGSLARYLLTIARNCAIGELRARAARARLVPPDELDHLAREPQRDASRGITEQQRSLLGDLMACVALLPKMQQQIVLADLQADGAADTDHLVALLGTSRNAIWAARSKAHKRLQQLLRERGHAF
jgi:RNA polymerase sigma-70 factor (ECF subfamily)